MPEYYIGLISGTSMDGIDAVVANFGDRKIRLLATHDHPYPSTLRDSLQQAIREPATCCVDDIGSLDRWVGECFRDAALEVCKAAGLPASAIRAIGSHGQTLRHGPDAPRPFSLQIGDPATIAGGTDITTVADFRRADIAAGGQGAPLMPPFHDWLFGNSGINRVILNIGGIANITILDSQATKVTGFDTGPGNTLLDRWIRQNRSLDFDRNGEWAATGQVDEDLLERMLADRYFSLPPPKSTGFEHFNLDWLAATGAGELGPEDVQSTLCELTARSIAADIEEYAAGTEEVLVCGGGMHNDELQRRLASNLPNATVMSTQEAGLDPDWIEAAGFAWLAMRTMNGQSGNLPSVTGASRKKVLGSIHYP